jgi:hypothetical protein
MVLTVNVAVVATAASLLSVLGGAAAGSEPNPPNWPKSVAVFGPTDDVDKIEAVIDAAFATNGGHDPACHGQFGPNRYAFLFKPGTYDVDCPVGYYTQVRVQHVRFQCEERCESCV